MSDGAGQAAERVQRHRWLRRRHAVAPPVRGLPASWVRDADWLVTLPSAEGPSGPSPYPALDGTSLNWPHPPGSLRH
jgi:hypothetical protein